MAKYVGKAVSSMETMYKKQQRKWEEKYAKTKKVQVCRRFEKMNSLVWSVCSILEEMEVVDSRNGSIWKKQRAHRRDRTACIVKQQGATVAN